jgi:hypothetical protein
MVWAKKPSHATVPLMGFFLSLYARKFSDPLHWLQGEDDSMWEKIGAKLLYHKQRKFLFLQYTHCSAPHVLSEIKLLFLLQFFSQLNFEAENLRGMRLKSWRTSFFSFLPFYCRVKAYAKRNNFLSSLSRQ